MATAGGLLGSGRVGGQGTHRVDVGRGYGQPPGVSIRPATTRSPTAAASASVSRRVPSAVAVITTGKIFRVRSGPPVAVSSSAASYRASTASVIASSVDTPGRYRFLSAALANS